MKVLTYIRNVHGLLFPRRLRDDSIFLRERPSSPKSTDLGAQRQLARFGVHQEDRHFVHAKVLLDHGKHLIEDLIKIEGGKNRLTRVVENGGFLHDLAAPQIQAREALAA